MNKRFCKLGTYAARAFFLFAVCGATYSCSDDYTLDDSNPTWLGSSIYEYLENQGNYNNFIKLINDLEYKEVLARTGSKTLFVADDDAFATFYQNNAWGVHSYDELTESQKKLLLNSAMVNNAYLLEMMSSTEAGNGDNDSPEKGQALRRETAADVVDSVPHLFAADLPISYNPDDKDYWERFRNSDDGIILALDATKPMMTHFLAAQMANKGITDADFQIITGRTREQNDAFIYDCKIIEKDITCQNGYLNKLDKVLINPQNMAEVLRTSGKTNIFSHMIDRFSAPFYDGTLSYSYNLQHKTDVQVYQKRYFSDRSQGKATLYNDANTDPDNPTGNTVFDANSNRALPFDPGWNTYETDRTPVEQDMAAIFCPTDEKLMEYFFSEDGGGRFLVKAYAPEMLDQITEETKDLHLVYQAIDQIPRQTIRALLNNLMKESFIGSVPSKFETIKNSAQDAMFDENYDYHRDKILGVLLANNGVIYLMDEVTTPAEYAAVSAPAYVETDKRIFNWAVQSASLGGGVPSNYYAYLLAMSARFSFFVPRDDNFWYIDPLSFYAPTVEEGTDGTILVGRAYNYTWDPTSTSATPKVTSYQYRYNIAKGTGELGQQMATETVSENCYGNRLKDMLESHTIIHEDKTEITGIDETQVGVECGQHYFLTKNGAVLYVDNADRRANGMTVKGGWQIESGEASNVIGFDDKSAQTNGYGNGYAYMINTPLIPTIESVYSAMYNNPDFSEFFELCHTDVEVLNEIDKRTPAAQAKYNIFEDNKGLPCYDKETGKQVERATNVRFFNNYRYTIYVPTNKAIEEAKAAGLPTWQDLRDILELDIPAEERTELGEDEIKARNLKVDAMATAIVNFVKNHFQDNSIFADTAPIAPTLYETATINSETGIYSKITVQSSGNGALTITDANGKVCNITDNNNIIVRDYVTDASNSTATAISIKLTSSSSAVIHGIDGVLDYKSYKNGRYDEDWTTEAKARAYLKQYQLFK